MDPGPDPGAAVPDPDRVGEAALSSRATQVLRAAFLLAVVVFAWLSLRGRFDEVGHALADTSPAGAAGALVLVLLGLTATGVLWLRLMAALGAELPFTDGSAMFFVGQLGKYIPGSVWSIGAQADRARRHDVPPRVTVAAGLLFLGYNVDTAALVGSLALISGRLDPDWPTWVPWVGLVVSLVGLAPPLVRLLARKIGGREPSLDLAGTGAVVVLLALAWACYSVALVLLAPGTPWHDLVALGGAFTIGYAVGVVIVFAPAGVGARETVFVLLLTPMLSVADATALALVARVVHTAADALMAAGWSYAARSRILSEPRSTP
ncbi:lysylphosphatidylglycerol synthase domain-containing protein [Nocardioides marmorisolisilvae]|uniref:Uncharacterized protein n=1 Tax=Nocardioides marmorisolisilvae TaxID=1542737 RepID=A0A3N0DTE4_9ACTN|nr:lysylphosphatidylglycerol synthase domain-containing protein [Nocardioides marmorisolisilvae]RNL78673.1 hypothetical protein EFL95_06205 [Nocardioides marmorisolisilvae]